MIRFDRRPTFRPLLLTLALSTGLTSPARAQSAAAASAPAGNSAAGDRAAVDRLYATAVRADTLPALVARLDAAARAGDADARLTLVDVLWQGGDRVAALAAADAAVAAAPTARSYLAKAELLDSLGRVVEATGWYGKAAAITVDPTVRRMIDRRVAVAEAVRRADTLAAFGRNGPAAEARRLAMVTALLGRPRIALDLASGTAAPSVAERLRLTEWALAAGDLAQARVAARQAFAAAQATGDRRYALALLVEAHRTAGSITGALADLEALPQTPDTVRARVDVLLETGRVAPALALIERSSDPALRARLTGVVDLAGDAAASEAEYRRLIARQPDRPEIYGRLAALYLARDNRAGALDVYRAMFAANRGRPEVLTTGARLMIGMGLQDQAVAMLSTIAADRTSATATHFFLFETQLDRGDVAKALAELDAIEKDGVGDAALVDVAEGYERLSRPEQAFALLRRLEARGAATGYDVQTRMAQLAARTGDDADALARWRRLWNATTLPARRHYVERQIVTLAKRMGRLQPLGDELLTRLDAGTLRPGEIDLLVAVRLAQEKPEAAADAVRQFAARSGQGEGAVLARLAQLYARVRDYDQLNATLRRQIAIDPANRDTNVRQLILNTLRHDDGTLSPAAKQAELDRLMAQFKDRGDAGSYQFKAMVYGEADLDTAALAQLRQGTAARPGDPDALLQLAAALKRQGRRGEGIGLLQYVADHGATKAFPAAVDGLVDMVADAAADNAEGQATLAWTQRRLLERIAADGATPRVLGLLADVAAAQADYDLQIRATEALLADAGEQRAFVLRELATLVGGGGGEEQSGPAIGNAARKLVYARRLLGLGKSFPPDLYANYARSLLATGDEAGAERAFAMMSDLGGLVNVDEAKGDAYAAAGRPDEALVNYARALLRDQNNYDLLVKTAVLREAGRDEVLAWRGYWRGLRTMVARQAAAQANGADGDLDVRSYYPGMVEGLLLTWPAAGGQGDAALAELQQQFDGAIAQVDRARPGMLAGYPKLALLVDLGHRIADAGIDAARIARWDTALDTVFAGDVAYRRAAALRRHLSGTVRDVVAAGDPHWPLAALRVQAGDSGNDDLRLVAALAADDFADAKAVLAGSLAGEEARRSGRAVAAGPGTRPSFHLSLLLIAMDRLPPERFRELVLRPLQASPVREDLLFDLLRGAGERYAQLEKIAGEPLLSPDTLVRLTVAGGERPLDVIVRPSRPDVGGPPWIGRLSSDQLIALYDGFVARLAAGGSDSTLAELALATLFSRPLDAAQGARLLAVMERDIGIARDPRARSAGPLLSRLLRLDAVPADRDLLMKAAATVSARYPDGARLPPLLARWFAGDKGQAYEQLTGLAAEVTPRYAETQWLTAVVERWFPEARAGEVDAFLADPRPDPARGKALYERFITGGEDIDDARRKALLRRLAMIDPADAGYRSALLLIHADGEDWGSFAALLATYVEAQPDDAAAATMLVMADRLAGRSAGGGVIARTAQVDANDPDGLIRILNQSRAANERVGGGIVGLFGMVYAAYLAKFPTDPAVVAVEARQGRSAGRVSPGDDVTVAPLVAAQSKAPQTVPQTLRRWWRGTVPALADGDAGRPRRALIATLSAAAGRSGEAREILARADVGLELRRYPRVMAAADQAGAQPLYDLGSVSERGQGSDEARRGEVERVLSAPDSDADALRRAAILADRLGMTLSPATLAALATRLRSMVAHGPDGRIVLARLFARAGDVEVARGLLAAALMQMFYPATPLDNADDFPAALKSVVATLSLWQDQGAAQRVYQDFRDMRDKRAAEAGGGNIAQLPLFAANAGEVTSPS